MSYSRLNLSMALLVPIAALLGCSDTQPLGPVADTSSALRIRTAITGSSGEGAADAGPAVTGTGWGTLRGKFIYDGEPPAMPPYQATKDMATCAPGGSAPPQETLLVDGQSRGIKNIAVYLRDASRVHESAQATDDSIPFDQKTCVFLSHVLGVTVGQTLNLMNSDPVGHNTNIDGRVNKFNQTIPAGATIPYPVQKEEATPAKVVCSIHPWMVAYLLPRENGYYAVTAEDGSFEIANLPAGEELELQVWHESAAGSGNSLVLNSPEAKQLKWSSKGRFKITLEEDSTQEFELVVPPTAFRG